MTPAEVVKVLAKASAYDQRTVGHADVMAWHEVLADIDPKDGLNAVAQHYANQTDRLMPAHIRRLATAAIRERHRAAREANEQAAIETSRTEPSRRDRSAAVINIIANLRTMLPDGHPDKLRRSEWVAWERAQARLRRRERRSKPGCVCSRGYILSEDGTALVSCANCSHQETE